MGIYNDYKQERRRAWFCYAIPIVAINTFDILFTLIQHLWYSMDGTRDTMKMLGIDLFQVSVSVTIAVSLNLLLHNIYTRYAALNLLLR